MPGKLILVRHGQSTWNVENLFTGWHDVDLSDQGRAEALQAGRELQTEKLEPNIAFTSVLKRAIRTLWIILDTTDRMWLPVEGSWRLNERHYGGLPAAESLKDTLSRVLPYWESRIVPELRDNKNVLIVAHGNSLRALVKMLDMMSEADIVEFNIPTGIPMLYELDEQIQPISRRFLGDPAAIAAAQEAVRRQTEKKDR